MLVEFIDHLNTLIARNEPEKAMDEIRKAIKEFKKNHPEQLSEIESLESQVILHSARLKELDQKERNIQLSSSEIEVARAKMYSALLGIISTFQDYPSFSEFVMEKGADLATHQAPPPTSRSQPEFPRSQPAYQTPPTPAEPVPVAAGKKTNPLVLAGGGIALVSALVFFGLNFLNKDTTANQSAQNAQTATNQSSADLNTPVFQQQPEEVPEDEMTEADAWNIAMAPPTQDGLKGFLDKYPNGEYALKAQQLLDSIQQAVRRKDEDMWNMARTANTMEAYQFYLSHTQIGTYEAQAGHRLDSIQQATSMEAQYERLLTMDEADTLTIQEKREFWADAFSQFSGEQAEQIQQKVRSYEQALASHATILADDKLVTCKAVAGMTPVGIRDEFTTGASVHAWARVNAPRSETVRLRWFDSQGQEVGSGSAIGVQTNTGLGYRIYASQRFETPGTYEIRVYNSENQLVGRQPFRVIN